MLSFKRVLESIIDGLKGQMDAREQAVKTFALNIQQYEEQIKK